MASPVFAKGVLLILLVVISNMNEEVEASSRIGLRSSVLPVSKDEEKISCFKHSGPVTGSKSVHPDVSQKIRPFEARLSPEKRVRDPSDVVPPPANIARMMRKSLLKLFHGHVPQVWSKQELQQI